MRPPNRPALLNAAIDEARLWPPSDFGCCDLIGFVAHKTTGEDRRALFPQYSTIEEANALIDEFGGLSAILTHAFGDPISVKRAQRGDAVIADVDGETICGICLGTAIALRSKSGGLTFRSIELARLAWRIE